MEWTFLVNNERTQSPENYGILYGKQERLIVAKYASLTPSYNHPRNFITIVSTVLEICSGQNSGMKINKGQ